MRPHPRPLSYEERGEDKKERGEDKKERGDNGANIRVGVDLGTAYTVLMVLDEHFQPVAGAYRFAQVVRDGLVVDFIGAIDLLKELKRGVERQLGFELTHAATGFPPGVPRAEVRATANVLRAAGLECTNVVDEPTAANAVLQIRDGAVVDVGGGTTGVAILRDGQVVYTADEATGGTHFSLVIAGALDIPFEQAEELKTDPREQARLFPLVEPVMEKVGTIVARHIARYPVNEIYMVGGASMYPGMGQVVERITGIKTIVPPRPLFITPLGIAMNDKYSNQ
ncbi:MAG: ethanolamine utilization protein EutJ [Chloroflexi bacterium]|nr:ethanolamine utilization protein EutJ [Chloroflexota bacterium]